jgi:hypothetical protein
VTTDSPKEVQLSTADTEEIGFVEFDDESFPIELKAQVLSFLRLRWPEGFSGDLRYRDWITRPEHLPYHLSSFCDPARSGFYAACGWTPMPHARTLVGGDGPATATESSELLLMRFVSDRGRRGRDGFLRSPLWIEDEW